MNLRNNFFWVIGLLVVLLFIFQTITSSTTVGRELAYSDFLTDVTDRQVRDVVIEDQKISGSLVSGQKFFTVIPIYDEGLINQLLGNDVRIEGKLPEKPSLLISILISWFPMILLIGVWIFFMRQMQGGGKGGAMSFGKSKARLMTEDEIKITFKDVAGCDEAKEEVGELVQYLKDPDRFSRLGGRLPSGVLMVGPPGTGKTLLAKAVAGEAKVPFFSISGSDFVEMFVGVGASRVRDMFEQAKKSAPCILFIDEIDAVGRKRGSGVGGGNDEREQTLNQMLVEMDGFSGNEGIIVIAATNRSDVLDPALLRPGRFDRRVMVGLPDVKGREQILSVHIKKIKIDDTVDAKVIARATPGFSGADLANLVNEAALFSARHDKDLVSQTEFEQAKDTILMGSERRSMIMSDSEKIMTAYHEAGHAIVGRLLPCDPVYKVTVIPRGGALGVTFFLPEEDKLSESREYLEARISCLYGGRIAEEIIYGRDHVTTGASQDIKMATELAYGMITNYGLSDEIGPVLVTNQMSQSLIAKVDAEVKALITKNYDRAEIILKENKDILESMKDALIEYETLDTKQIDVLMARKKLPDLDAVVVDSTVDPSE